MKTEVAESEVKFSNLHQDLIDGCKEGDQKAQFQIYKLYYKAMYNISLRIVNDPVEAEDIMQEAFLSAFEKIGTYSGTVSFGAWLKKIVHNRSIDYLIKNRKYIFEDIESSQLVKDLCIEESCQNDDPDPRIIKVMKQLQLLPEKLRNVFSLYLLEGYDHEEIGEIMSISCSASRSQLFRAKDILRRGIEGR